MDYPSWINLSFLEKVLQGGENKQPRTKVLTFTVSPGVTAGNNCTSSIYKIEIDYKCESNSQESITLLIKDPLTTGIFSNKEVFRNEPKLYNELFPYMYSKANCTFAPDSYYCPLENGIILKDLRADGYTMHNKVEKLDFNHCKAVLETLAKFHATSVACTNEDPDFVKTLREHPLFKEGETFEKILRPWLSSASKQIMNQLNEVEGAELLKYWLENRIDGGVAESLIKFFKPNPNGFNVINHGDCWTNNILFKYNNNQDIADCKFIDFQLSSFNSPIPDVTYFVWTSAKKEVLNSRLQELFDIYISTLNQTLEKLKCKQRLHCEEFQDELKSSIDWIIFPIIIGLPLILCPQDKFIDVENFSPEDFEHDENFLNMFNYRNYKDHLHILCKQLEILLS